MCSAIPPPRSNSPTIRGARQPAACSPTTALPRGSRKTCARTLSNPKGEPRTSHARTPHHLLNGTITPNGLHFVISHSGNPDIDPDKHRLVIHGLVQRPLVFTLDALMRYPMVSRMAFIECGGNGALLASKEPMDANVQALHGLVSCAEWTGVMLSTLLERNRHRPEGEMAHRRRRGLAGREPQRADEQGARRRHDRALPERRAAHAWQRLSDAPAPSRLGRQHEHQISAAAQARRRARHELLRVEDLRADPAGRKGVPVLFPPGGQILHHPPVSWPEVERSRASTRSPASRTPGTDGSRR